MKIFLLTITFLQISLFSSAQLQDQVTQDAAEQSVLLNEELTEDVNPVELENLAKKKVDLNTDDYDDLIRLQLMSISQAEALTKHKQQFGPLIALQELQVVQEFSLTDLHRIVPYVSVQKQLNPSEGRRELIIRNRKSLGGYKGSWFDQSGILIKCRYDINQQFSTGILAEKDADESFGFGSNKYGMDHTSAYVQFRGTGFIRKAIVGDYRIQYGQGLTAWTGSAFGAGSVTAIFRAGMGISPSVTVDENNYLRGIAVSFGKGKWTTDLFFSGHLRDAKIYTDSSGNNYFTSLLSTGLHRYTDELNTRKKIKDHLVGSSLQFENLTIKTGLVISRRSFSSAKKPNGGLYDQFDIDGKSISNMGWNYRFHFWNIIFFGETAIDEEKNISTTNGCIISVTKKVTMAILKRDFSIRFKPVYSNPFGAGTSASNESGTYLGFTFQLSKALTVTSSLDSYRFPFLRYRIDKPSSGADFMQQIDYVPGKKLNMQFRYRYRQNEINSPDEWNELQLMARSYQSFRFSSRFSVDDNWDYGMRADYLFNGTTSDKKQGVALSADLFYHPKMTRFKWNFRYAVFYCPDFESRIYQHENDLPGTFTIPFYYGKGNRTYVNLQYSMSRSTSLAFRYAVNAFNNGNRTSDLKVQLRWKL